MNKLNQLRNIMEQAQVFASALPLCEEFEPARHTTPHATRSECRAALIDAEGSELLAEVFNRMTIEQKNSVSPEIAERIGNFMVKNGYRIVFTRWYLQAEPDKA